MRRNITLFIIIILLSLGLFGCSNLFYSKEDAKKLVESYFVEYTKGNFEEANKMLSANDSKGHGMIDSLNENTSSYNITEEFLSDWKEICKRKSYLTVETVTESDGEYEVIGTYYIPDPLKIYLLAPHDAYSTDIEGARVLMRDLEEKDELPMYEVPVDVSVVKEGGRKIYFN